MKPLALALLLGLMAPAPLLAAPAPAARQEKNLAPVMTGDGALQGVSHGGVTQFLGLPYAAPPVGHWRWMPPQPPAKWAGVRQAAKFGPTCAQITTLGPFAGPPNANEDCLYLNVFAPAAARKLPVLVWIHGGGYVDGESNDYDGGKLAARGRLVVVTINYRLNLFGFLSVPALNREGHASGNYGLMDVQAALKWVRANIAAFGGDPGNVTLGGQSAGAGLAAANLVSPGAAGLFHRAILQSGGYTPFATKAVAQAHGAKFAAAAGCGKAPNQNNKDVAACLRALPAAKILALSGTASANGRFITGPMVDGTVIPRQTLETIAAGAYNKVPVMIGTTRDEGNFTVGIAQYFRKGHAPASEADFRAYAAAAYDGNAGPGGSPPAYPKGTVQAVLAHYTGAAQPAWDGAHTDAMACRGQHTAAALAARGPVYSYEFDDRTAPSYFPKMPGFQPMAYHTADLSYLFAGYHGGPQGVPTRLSAKQEKLSDRLVKAWANFARSGNPNGLGDRPWPRWKQNGPAVFLQDDAWARTRTSAQFAAAHQCGFWNSILRYQ